MLTRGPTEDKLRWTFRLYDIDGDGRIERREMREIIASVYLMLGKHTEPSVEQDTPSQHADKVFEVSALSRTDRFSIDKLLQMIEIYDSFIYKISIDIFTRSVAEYSLHVG
ncbi:calsenilin [Trichonephila inaurata madagascariensis]|uniref:Calsenilin n=1 Tax=Trichonephila inaurata madagascariensis TaxID=2747483 RepID=A0A8X6J2S7_9ARAC|nr:calsenilin [Trichonephila inaurata madagascariensis]